MSCAFEDIFSLKMLYSRNVIEANASDQYKGVQRKKNWGRKKQKGCRENRQKRERRNKTSEIYGRGVLVLLCVTAEFVFDV